jgi:Two component regulator propeller
MRIVLKIKIFFQTILILLSVSAFCHAEIANSSSAIKATAPQEVRFTHLTSKNGLSSDSVIGVAQDNRGFIWFTTLQGLNRYDGYDFKVYKNDPVTEQFTRYQHDPNNVTSLSHDSVREVYVHRQGVVWVGFLMAGSTNLTAKRKNLYITGKTWRFRML